MVNLGSCIVTSALVSGIVQVSNVVVLFFQFFLLYIAFVPFFNEIWHCVVLFVQNKIPMCTLIFNDKLQFSKCVVICSGLENYVNGVMDVIWNITHFTAVLCPCLG
jgi:hypothetical protein